MTVTECGIDLVIGPHRKFDTRWHEVEYIRNGGGFYGSHPSVPKLYTLGSHALPWDFVEIKRSDGEYLLLEATNFSGETLRAIFRAAVSFTEDDHQIHIEDERGWLG